MTPLDKARTLVEESPRFMHDRGATTAQAWALIAIAESLEEIAKALNAPQTYVTLESAS